MYLLGGQPVNDMDVLSLFDGMSCGQLALNKAGVEYNKYYASEIDIYAMKVAQKNYPNTTQVGSVEFVTKEMFSKQNIGLLIGGSPCQSFSRAGNGKGFDGESALFWEYVRVLRELEPRYFLLENVLMKKEWEDIITEALGVEPIEISSAKFVPQSRRRLYWTNIPGVKQPDQKEYNVSDYILDGDGFPTSCNTARFFKAREIFSTLTATYWKGIRGSGRPAVSTEEGVLDDNRDAHRMLTPRECEAIQGVPLGYTDGVSKTQRYKMLGNGWTVDVIAHILKTIELNQNKEDE